MGTLTSYLQQSFSERCPAEWVCRSEVCLLPRELEQLLGYSSRADVLLERRDGSRRLWIEFEVSRADPVANHVKFATAHLFVPQLPSDAFVSIVSSHVDRGRRNLAANTIALMRHVGMSAFQTTLLPHVSAAEIKRLNHLDVNLLSNEELFVEAEIERALSVSEAVMMIAKRQIYLVGDILDVMLNLRRWNKDIDTIEGHNLWKKRTITYFVYDPRTMNFAPSKFCAYVPIPTASSLGIAVSLVERAEMTIRLYVNIDSSDKRFDGNRAQNHLTKNLAMSCYTSNEAPDIKQTFDKWLSRHAQSITVHPIGPNFLTPPRWFK